MRVDTLQYVDENWTCKVQYYITNYDRTSPKTSFLQHQKSGRIGRILVKLIDKVRLIDNCLASSRCPGRDGLVGLRQRDLELGEFLLAWRGIVTTSAQRILHPASSRPWGVPFRKTASFGALELWSYGWMIGRHDTNTLMPSFAPAASAPPSPVLTQ